MKSGENGIPRGASNSSASAQPGKNFQSIIHGLFGDDPSGSKQGAIPQNQQGVQARQTLGGDITAGAGVAGQAFGMANSLNSLEDAGDTDSTPTRRTQKNSSPTDGHKHRPESGFDRLDDAGIAAPRFNGQFGTDKNRLVHCGRRNRRKTPDCSNVKNTSAVSASCLTTTTEHDNSSKPESKIPAPGNQLAPVNEDSANAKADSPGEKLSGVTGEQAESNRPALDQKMATEAASASKAFSDIQTKTLLSTVEDAAKAIVPPATIAATDPMQSEKMTALDALPAPSAGTTATEGKSDGKSNKSNNLGVSKIGSTTGRSPVARALL